jgi:micrococcal nuclease
VFTTGLAALVLSACGDATGSDCGPITATVARVIDGDTIELDSGERVRYLLVDTPESTGGQDDCYGAEAAQFNRELVEGKQIRLEYDQECTDRFDRLLAYVTIDDRDVNGLLIERGYACVLHIPPNGEDRVDAYEDLEALAAATAKGMWGACPEIACE